MTRDRALLGVRVLAGAVFVIFGAGKFANHSSELASFKTYGLPAPGVFVVAVGVIELLGGLLLIGGLLAVPAALALAGDMIGAITVSGVARGELVSLTIAPAELLAMLVLLLAGSGCLSLRPSPPLAVTVRRALHLLRVRRALSRSSSDGRSAAPVMPVARDGQRGA